MDPSDEHKPSPPSKSSPEALIPSPSTPPPASTDFGSFPLSRAGQGLGLEGSSSLPPELGPRSRFLGERLDLSGGGETGLPSPSASAELRALSAVKLEQDFDFGENSGFSSVGATTGSSVVIDFGTFPALGFSSIPSAAQPASAAFGGDVEGLGFPSPLGESHFSSADKPAPLSSLSSLQVLAGSAGSKDGDGEPKGVPAPLESLHGVPIPPFLSKTYDLVEEPLLDPIISWGPSGESFVVWDPVEFAKYILPRHFKHNNFSSFVRQLNTYGFRKKDTDKWEFANEDFQQGKRHLLKNIQRRRSSQVSQLGHYMGPSLEVGKSGMEGELEKLRKDKGLLMEELMQLKHEHHATVHKVGTMNQRLVAAEQKQNQMVSFLAKVLQNPIFLENLQRLKEQREGISTLVKRKFLKQKQAGQSNPGSSVDTQIFQYKPKWSDATTSKVMEPVPDSGEHLEDYLLQDMVGKLELDAVTGQQPDIGGFGTDDLEKELVEASHQNAMELSGLPIVDPADATFKGKSVLSSRVDTGCAGTECVVSFPEDLSPELMSSVLMATVAETEISMKQEDIWSMGFDIGATYPSSSHDMWGNLFTSNIQELEGSTGLGNIWDLGPEQVVEGLGVDKWHDEEPTFDDTEAKKSQLDDHPTNMDP